MTVHDGEVSEGETWNGLFISSHFDIIIMNEFKENVVFAMLCSQKSIHGTQIMYTELFN